jgi:hypothetical protein
MQEVKKMFKRSFVTTLIAILVLFGAAVTYSSAQNEVPISPLFNDLLTLAYRDLEIEPEAALEKLPLLLDELMPQGIIILPTPPGEVETDTGEVVEVKPEMAQASKEAHEEFLAGVKEVKGLTEAMAPMGGKMQDGAVRVMKFLDTMQILSVQARDFIADGTITAVAPRPPIQILNPTFFPWWIPFPDTPREIEEKAFTAEIPIWGAAIIVKEVKGVKLEIGFWPIPWNPCWWHRLGIRPWWRIWWIRLIPAEFIKTITYVNTWDAQNNQPKIVKTWDTEIIPEIELIKFWWFLADPKGAPPKEGENPQTMRLPAKKAITWGNLKCDKY